MRTPGLYTRLRLAPAAKHHGQDITTDVILAGGTYASSSSKKLVAWWSTFLTLPGSNWVLSWGQEGVFAWSDGQRILGGGWWGRKGCPSILSSALLCSACDTLQFLRPHFQKWEFCCLFQEKKYKCLHKVRICVQSVNRMLSKVCSFACFLYPQENKTCLSRLSKQNMCRK